MYMQTSQYLVQNSNPTSKKPVNVKFDISNQKFKLSKTSPLVL